MPQVKIDFSQPMLDHRGRPFDPPATLGEACANALLASGIPDDKADGAEKAKRFLLACEVAGDPTNGPSEISLTAEKIATIKDMAGKVFPTMAAGRIWQMIDGPD